jgi:peptidyl-tRNA hydrolase, PTH2 family
MSPLFGFFTGQHRNAPGKLEECRKYKMVICYRKDLKMGKGKLAAQVAHAATNCALQARKQKRQIFKNWLSSGQRKVVVKVENKAELYRIQAQAQESGLVCSLIIDAGLTQIEPGTPTCIGVGPDREETVDALTANYPLG